MALQIIQPEEYFIKGEAYYDAIDDEIQQHPLKVSDIYRRLTT